MVSRLSATTLPMLPTRLQERDADRLYAMRDLVMPNSFSRKDSSIREITLDLAFGRKMEIRDRLLDPNPVGNA